MALAQVFYSLRNVRPKLKTGLSPNLTEMGVKRNFVWEQKWPGQLFTPSQAITGENIPEISGNAYLDANFNWELVPPNTPIILFDFLSPSDGATQSLLGTDFFLKWPANKMTITLDSMQFDEKLGMCPFTIHANVLNAGAFGGFPGYPIAAGGGDA